MHTAYSIQFLYKNTGHLPIKIAILDHRTSLGASAVLSCDLPCSGCQLLRLPSPDSVTSSDLEWRHPPDCNQHTTYHKERENLVPQWDFLRYNSWPHWLVLHPARPVRKKTHAVKLSSCHGQHPSYSSAYDCRLKYPAHRFHTWFGFILSNKQNNTRWLIQTPNFQPVFGSKTPQKIAMLPPKTLRLVPRHPHVKDLMSMVQAESPGVASGSNVSHPTVKRIQPLKLPGRCDRLLCWPYQVESRTTVATKNVCHLPLYESGRGRLVKSLDTSTQERIDVTHISFQNVWVGDLCSCSCRRVLEKISLGRGNWMHRYQLGTTCTTYTQGFLLTHWSRSKPFFIHTCSDSELQCKYRFTWKIWSKLKGASKHAGQHP